MKKPIKLIVILVVLIFTLGLLKNILAKAAVQVGAKAVLGVDSSIKKFSIGILNQSIDIREFKLSNPKGFDDDVLIDLPQATVKYDLLGLLKGKLHCQLVVLNLKEVVVIKNKEGLMNTDELTIAKQQKAQAEQPPEEQKPQKQEKSKEMPMQLDKVVLTIGKVVYKDYSKGGDPEIKIFDVGIKDKEYTDITSAQELASLIFAASLKSTAIKSAAMYGATAVLGVGLLPVGVAGVLTSKDSAQADFNVSFEDAFKASEAISNDIGTNVEVKKDIGQIEFQIGKTKVKVLVEKLENKKISITVSARKLMIPRRQEAEGVLYKIKELIEK
ncbi:MAG: hypothetical protein KKD07_07670 [Candidatus Omnitrophica bacterium]|nr:hypothetical protein [Candidatus Omnitrophota bacterium]MBU4334299.1 hypothetical protein [Candidatus Omnitrophota bacterium]